LLPKPQKNSAKSDYDSKLQGNYMKNQVMILLCALTLSSCGKEQFSNKENDAINNKIKQFI